MSNFPISYDDDVSLPIINDNIVEIGGEAINAIRDATFQIEQEIGLGASGIAGSISQRLNISFNPDGTLKPSAITSLGLVTLPITNNQIINNAEIPESKLRLEYRTSDLYNYIRNFSNDINTSLGWISLSGSKVEPHIAGSIYRHTLDQIDISTNPADFLYNKFREYRDNSNLFNLTKDINTELLEHQFTDGTDVSDRYIITNNGTNLSINYAHPADGIFLNTSRFSTIPQTIEDIQNFAEFIDSSSMFLYGTRVQNLYSNGISRVSRSSNLIDNSLGKNIGQSIVPLTPAIAHLLNNGTSSSPVDDVNIGDDIIEFVPSITSPYTNSFEEQFSSVKAGDIVRINYGSASPIEVSFVIKEKKYITDLDPNNRKFLVRIAGKNLFYSATATARIDKPLFNNNKFGALSIAAANNGISSPTLIIGNPRNAMALGLGFNPDLFDSIHYLLYLALYPTGSPQDGYVILPAIDVTGNAGATPGLYNLDYIVETTNNQFRKHGFNYRFIAFSYQGEMGIMLADSYNNAAFSIINAVVDDNGNYDQLSSNVVFPNNVVGIFATGIQRAPDPLGFGTFNANIVSPTYRNSYGSSESALITTKLFIPLVRNNYYVNGVEKDKLSLDVGQILDGYGDGYWVGTISNKSIYGGSPGSVEVTYRIKEDLSTSFLSAGKTLVIQSLGSGSLVDYGRFIVKGMTFGCGSPYTDITVYDAVHAAGYSPTTTANSGDFAIYFNSDSVSFNKESATDFQTMMPTFKRHFEVYVDSDGKTFTHERGRIYIGGSQIQINNSTYLYSDSNLMNLNLIKISPKLRGYQFGSVNKITLRIISFDGISYSGYLCRNNGGITEIDFSKRGPTVSGRIGVITRFYDETSIDYIDIIFDVNSVIIGITNKTIDFQLFPTLSLDDELMLIGTCQLSDTSNIVNYLRDERQFGNTSEKDLSTSAINFISLPDKLLHANGVINGFDLVEDPSGTDPNPNIYGQIRFKGGSVLVNGKILLINSVVIGIPPLYEIYSTNNYKIAWAICINSKGEYQTVPLSDYDLLIPTPNAPNRNLYVSKNAGTSYYVESSTFSNIINNRKDLTILYIVVSDVLTNTSQNTLIVSDARKYITDIDNNLPLRFDNYQSNFKDLNSLFNWMKYDGYYNGNICIRNENTVLRLTSFNFGGLDSDIVINGEKSSVLDLSTSQINIYNNIIFKNITLSFSSDKLNINSNTQNITFDNCILNFKINTHADYILLFNECKNVSFINCTLNFNIRYNSLPSIFKFETCEEIKLINNIINVTYSNSATLVPDNILYFNNCTKVVVQDSIFNGGFCELIKIGDGSNGITISNCIINSDYNPLGIGSYSTTNLVNTGIGYIFGSIGTNISDIQIDKVSFNYSPLGTLTTYDRYSFINFQLTNNNSIIKNLKITNCKFNDNNIPTGLDSIRSVVSIINIADPNSSYLPCPTLLDSNISGNICNKNQLILLTSKILGTDGYMKIPGLMAQNCTISNNVCGTIGYWINSGAKYLNISPNTNSYNDKSANLSIDGNTCHYISAQDHTGYYFKANKLISSVATNMCEYPSGFISIKNNNVNWIHTSIAYEDNSCLQILNNNLYSYNINYVRQYCSDISFVPNIAIMVISNKFDSTYTYGQGNGSSCIISGNIINVGEFIVSNTISTYKYLCGIRCKSSNTITKNILKGIDCQSTYSMLEISGKTNICTDNQFYRNNNSIHAYIAFNTTDFSPWDGTNSSGIITNNYFDSPIIDNTSLSENTIDYLYNFPSWIVEKNINQTGYTMIPITNGISLYGENGFYYNASAPNTYIKILTDNKSVPDGTSNVNMHYKSPVLWLNRAETTAFYTGWQESLDKYLPNNVRVLKLQLGVKRFSMQVETPITPPSGFDSNIFMFLNTYQTCDLSSTSNYSNLDYLTDPLVAGKDTNILNDTDVNNHNGPMATVTGANLNNNSLNYLTIDTTSFNSTDISKQFIIGNNYNFSVSLDIHLKALTTINMCFSPLIVKYRW